MRGREMRVTCLAPRRAAASAASRAKAPVPITTTSCPVKGRGQVKKKAGALD